MGGWVFLADLPIWGSGAEKHPVVALPAAARRYSAEHFGSW